MQRLALISSLLLFLLSYVAAASHAEDWPRFRGAGGTGVNDSQGLPSEIGPEAHVLWKIESDAGSSSPIIVNGKLFLTSFVDTNRNIECRDAATGELLWKQTVVQVRDETTNQLNGPATCTPAADGENIVVFFPDTALLCYSPQGELKWRTEVGPYHSMHGIASSPIIADGKVLLLVDQLRDSHLAAYDLQSGVQLWKVDRVNGLTGGYSTPTVLHGIDGPPLVLTTGPGGLIAYDLSTGKSLFSVPGISNAPVTLPLVLDRRVFVCEPVGEAMPISMLLPTYDQNKDGKLSFQEAGKDVAILRLLERIEREWGNGDEVVETAEWDKAFQSFVNNGGLVAVDVAGAGESCTGKVAWNYRKEVPYIASPIVHDGLLYLVDNGGLVTIIAPGDGTMISKKRLRKGGKQFYASPVAADGKIILLDTAGQLTVLSASEPWEELSTASLGEACIATPAIADGRIHVRTKSHLYCFGNAP